MSKGRFEKRAPRQGGSEDRGNEERRVAPGKVTRTSKLAPRAGQVVQRQPRASASSERQGQARPARLSLDDPAILAAHGFPAEADTGNPQPNAHMIVKAYGADGAVLAEWTGLAFFYGPLPVHHWGEGPPWQWSSPDAESIKVGSDAAGIRGKPLAAWAPRGSRRIMVDVVSRDNGSGSNTRPGGHDGDNDDGHAQGTPGGQVDGQVDGTGQGQAGQGTGATGGLPGGTPEGRSERGRPGGHAGGSEDPSWIPGGKPGPDGGRLGDEGGKAWGHHGGRPGAHGHVDGWDVWGVLDVPAEIAPLVNVAAIVADANVAGFGSKLLRRAVEGVARNVLRKQIRAEARRVAREGLERVTRRLDTLDKYKHLPAAERQAILERAEMAMSRGYRRRLAKHAGDKADEHERTLASLAGRTDEQAEHLRKIARENVEAYRGIQEAALAGEIRATGKLGGKPTGTRTAVRGNAQNRRSLARENESADVLAANGYRVEQNTVTGAQQNAAGLNASSEPDYLIEGKIFDNYAPSSNKAIERVRDEISRKVRKGQTRNVVVNLNDSPIEPGALRQMLLDRKPIVDIESVIVVKGNRVVQIVP